MGLFTARPRMSLCTLLAMPFPALELTRNSFGSPLTAGSLRLSMRCGEWPDTKWFLCSSAQSLQKTCVHLNWVWKSLNSDLIARSTSASTYASRFDSFFTPIVELDGTGAADSRGLRPT